MIQQHVYRSLITQAGNPESPWAIYCRVYIVTAEQRSRLLGDLEYAQDRAMLY